MVLNVKPKIQIIYVYLKFMTSSRQRKKNWIEYLTQLDRSDMLISYVASIILLPKESSSVRLLYLKTLFALVQHSFMELKKKNKEEDTHICIYGFVHTSRASQHDK